MKSIFSDEDKIFYMDPGFSVPEYSDLLELDLKIDKELLSGEEILT